MDNYKKMYLHLFNRVTKALEILKEAQCQCEEIFINIEETDTTQDKHSKPQ